MMSDYVIVSIKLCPEVENDEYIIVGGGGAPRALRLQEVNKKAQSE